MDNELDEPEQQEHELVLAQKTVKVFNELCSNMPPIGFFSHSKRLSAYVAITTKAQSLIDAGQISEGEILFILSMMIRKKKDFQKAAMVAALSLPKLDPEKLPPLGFKYANDMRVNMRLSPVEVNSSDET